MSKKRVIISLNNLPSEIKEEFQKTYPYGYSDKVQKIQKPNGDTIFVVPLETESAIYMVKVDVKIDTKMTDEEFEKAYLMHEDEPKVKLRGLGDEGEEGGEHESLDAADTDAFVDDSHLDE